MSIAQNLSSCQQGAPEFQISKADQLWKVESAPFLDVRAHQKNQFTRKSEDMDAWDVKNDFLYYPHISIASNYHLGIQKILNAFMMYSFITHLLYRNCLCEKANANFASTNYLMVNTVLMITSFLMITAFP